MKFLRRDPLNRIAIKYKLPLSFVILCLLAFGIGGYLVASSVYHSLEEEIMARLTHESFSYAIAIEKKMESLERRTEDFASDGFIRTAVQDQGNSATDLQKSPLITHLRENKLPLERAFTHLAIYDTSGRLTAGVGPTGLPRSRSPRFTPLPDSTALRLFASETGVYTAITTPLWDLAHSRVIGRFTSFVDMKVVLHRIARDYRNIFTQSDLLTTLHIIGSEDRGIRIAWNKSGRSPAAPNIPKTFTPTLSYLTSGITPNPTGHTGHHSHGTGPMMYGKSYSLESTGWTILVELNAEHAFLPISEIEGKFLGTGLSIALATLILLYFPVQFLIRPLNRLTQMAKSIKEGDFSARVSIDSSDEIGRLADMFNHMAASVEARTRNLEKTARDLERREKELRTEHDRLLGVVNSMQDSLLLLNRDGKVILSNEAAGPLKRILDGNVQGLSVSRCGQSGKISTDCIRCLHSQSATGTCMLTIHDTIYEVLATSLPVSGRQGGKVIVARDITERERMHEQQTQEERLAVLGEVSAVVAHELNSPLAAISMYGQMMERELDTESDFREHIDVILRNTDTCRRIIKDILDYARSPDPEIVQVNIDALIRDVIRFLRPVYEKSDVALYHHSEQRGCTINGDRTQLQQLFVNLIMNAIQAIPDEGGRIDITVDQKESDVCIEVADSGEGIPEDQAEKIFEPFYTTKSTGGTGLGLSTANSIARSHGGELVLVSGEPGCTVFRVTIPAWNQENPIRGGKRGSYANTETAREREVISHE